VLASGILGTSAALMARVAAGGAGAVTAKSCSVQSRAGHPNPTVLDWGYGAINAVGLANPGIDEEIEILHATRQQLDQAGQGVRLIASIFGTTIEDYTQLTQRLHESPIDLLEVNISCPNVHDELARPFAASCASAAAVTQAVKRVAHVPVIVKLSPNVTDIAEIARAVEDAGADAIAAINTVAGMVIDVRAARPVLANREGGLSGPAIKPVAVRCIYECYRAVKIPILGIGGVSCGEDAAELLLAGAAAVGVGTVVHQRGVDALGQIGQELMQFMAEEGYSQVAQLVGRAHG
jgi:dihydroorotate dehydrogenase (NAD+) catalytic subunit